MPDWRAYVEQHLPPLGVSPEREMEITGELAQQLEQTYNDAILAGASEPEAERRAQLQFPDWNALAREIRAAEVQRATPLAPESGGNLWSGVLHDLRYAVRLLRKDPALTSIAIATLAFGIGANAAVFSVVDALVLRSLPYPASDQLMAIESTEARHPEVEAWTSVLDFFDLREKIQAFSAVAAISPVWNNILTGRGNAERIEALYVSQSFFPMLGVQPSLGRGFLPKEDNGTVPSRVAILGHAFWQSHFGGNASAIGQNITLDGATYNVVGVLPAGFRYVGEPLAGTASDIDVWMPLADNQIVTVPRAVRYLKVLGRLKPGVSPTQADQEIRRFGAAMATQYADSNKGLEYRAVPLRQRVAGRVQATLLLLLGAVGLVLLLACANVAGLLLVRGAARQKEFSVRITLGASAYRLVRQLFTEVLVLSAFGGIAGFLLGLGVLQILIAVGPENLWHGATIALDRRAFSYTAAVVFASALFSTLPPALRILNPSIETALRQSGRGLTGGTNRLRSALVVAQMALALTLVVGAGLLIHSFLRLMQVNPGFSTRDVITMSTQVPPEDAASPQDRTAIYRLIRDRLLAMPGVRDVGAISRLPLMGSNLGARMWIEGRNTVGAEAPAVEFRRATPSYFSTMGLALRSGRLLDDRDDANPRVALVNESALRRYWPGDDAVGKRIKLGPNPESQQWLSIVGVVGDIRHFGLDVDPVPEVYLPYAASPLTAPILVVRTTGDPASILQSLATAVRSVHPGLAVYNVFRMQELVERSTAQRRFAMMLLTAFATAALLLAAIGIYGTVSQSVLQRTPEIGLRMALGASPAGVMGEVLRRGLMLALMGVVFGSVAAYELARLMRSMLFGVSSLDPVVFAVAALTLGLLTVIACYVPARRAAAVDPVVALRSE